MDIKFTENDNIYYAMKSMFRHELLIEMKAPQILIDTEVYLLKSRMAKLTNKDMDFIKENWEAFKHQQKIEYDIQDKELEHDFSEYIKNLN